MNASLRNSDCNGLLKKGCTLMVNICARCADGFSNENDLSTVVPLQKNINGIWAAIPSRFGANKEERVRYGDTYRDKLFLIRKIIYFMDIGK